METSENEKKEKNVLEDLSKEDLIKQVKKTLSLLRTAKTKYTEANQRCADLETEKDELSKAVSTLKSKNNNDSVDELEKKVIALQEANKSKALEIQSYEQNLKSAKQSKENLMRQCAENEEQVNCMKMQMDTLRVTCQCLQEEISKLTTRNSELKSENEVLTSARDTALEAVHSVKGKLSSAEKASAALQNEIDALKKDNEDLKNELSSALESKENAFKAFSLLEEESAEISNKYSELCREKHKLQSSIDDIEDLLHEKDSKLNELETRCKELETFISEVNNEKNNLDQQVEELKNEKLQSEASYISMCEERDNLQIQLSQVQSKILSLQESQVESSNIEKITMKLEQDLLASKEEISQLKNDNEKLKQEMEQDLLLAKDKISKLTDDNQQLKEELEHDLAGAKEEISQLLKNNERLKEELEQDLFLTKDKVSELAKDNERLVKDLEASNAKLHNLGETLSSYETEKSVISSKISTILNTNVQENMSFTDLFEAVYATHHLSEAKEGNSQLIKDKEKLEELEQDLTVAKRKINQLSTDNERLEDEVEALSMKLHNMGEALSSYEVERCLISSKADMPENLSFTQLFDAISLKHSLLDAAVSNFQKQNSSGGYSNSPCAQCEAYQHEITSLSDKFDNLMKDNMVLRLEVEKYCHYSTDLEALEKEKGELETDCSALREKLEQALKEIESLKQQLDEYENDIQKHLNLEKENYELQDLTAELQRENENLSECLDNKCVEVDDIMGHIESLISSLQEKAGLQDSVEALKSSDSNFQSIVALESFCDMMILKLSNRSKQIECLENSLKEANRAKELLQSELAQVQDLKQFLEDEVKELREESEQLKKEMEEKRERDTTCAVTAVETEVPAECTLPLENDAESIIKKLTEENQELMEKLVDKSQLVENIHCQLDVVLCKVEEQNQEMQQKSADLDKANAQIADLQKQVKDLKNTISQMQNALQKTSSVLSSLREAKDHVPEFISQYSLEVEKTLSGVNKEVEAIRTNFYNCYNLLENSKAEHSLTKDENLHLKTSVYQFFKDILSEIMSLNENQRSQIQSLQELHQGCWEECNIDTDSVEKLLTRVNQLKVVFKSMVQYAAQLMPNNMVTSDHDSSHLKTGKQNEHRQGLDVQSISSQDKTTEMADQPSCSECAQLQKDLKDTETKMAKFKAVAVKWKKELTELKQKYSIVISEKNKLEEDCSQLSSAQRQHMQNFQSLQNEYDKLQDEMENMRSEQKTMQSDLALTISELSNFKLKVDDMNSELKKSEEQLAVSESDKAQLKSKIADLESQLIISDSKISDWQMKVQSLKHEIEELEKKIVQLTKEKKELKENLDEALKESKQHSMLDLEMADYERTIAELTESLEKRNSRISDLEEDVEVKSSKVLSLEEEIRLCEAHRDTEVQRAESFKKVLEDSKQELSQLHESESQLKNEVVQLKSRVESLTLMEEDYKTKHSEQSAEVEQMKEMLRSSGQNHERIVRSLKSKVSSLEQELLLAHKEVESVKQDFENYKIRVHSVLKQQKSVVPFSTSDAEAKEQLESQNEKLKLQLKDMSEKLLAQNLEGDSLRVEHEHLLQRHNKVVEELGSKDLYWSKRLESVNEEKKRLQLVMENMTSEQALKNEMLATSYKKQMQMLQSEHKRDIDELQKQLDTANAEILRLQREPQRTPSTANSMIDESFSFDILSQERQEGEGSECTDGENTPVRHLSLATIPTSGFIPLEKLIQSSTGSHTPTSMISNHDSERLSNELNASWKKIDHLTELLNESEANNVRFSEQVRVLKEEVRRLERNELREEHGKNLEYLKNVFLKFATLQPGSERTMLIQVLNTMLKLSPEEVQQLKLVAGADNEPDSSSTGWGNYLHRWSGLM